ncbi:hypothetical protein JNW88_30885 [Micromonospora sp. ATA32]|nr:hypothetical protein [Micromonospora sp. ATA32]
MGLIVGIDRFMSEARALTNFAGNAVATVLVGTWTGEFDRDQARAVLGGQRPFDESTMLDEDEDEPAEERPGPGRARVAAVVAGRHAGLTPAAATPVRPGVAGAAESAGRGAAGLPDSPLHGSCVPYRRLVSTRRLALVVPVVILLAGLMACTSREPTREALTGPSSAASSGAGFGPLVAGMPTYPAAGNVYAAAGPNQLAEQVRGDRPMVYVPNTKSNDVWMIDPATFQVVGKFAGGPEPQHVVPSYDLRTLYVASSQVPRGGVIPIDARTGKPGRLVNLEDVYNLYFTPDGKEAIVVAEAFQRLDLYDPKTWKRTRSVRFPECGGINHMDYSADGRTMLFSCEFANRMVVLDTTTLRKVREFRLTRTTDGMPQDTRLTPDGQHFLVADMHAHGVYVFDARPPDRPASSPPAAVPTASTSAGTPRAPTSPTGTRGA